MAPDPVFSPATSAGSRPDVQMILGDRRWGDTVEKRAATFATARRWVGGLTLAGAAAMGWALAYPHPYTLMMALLMGLPVISLLQLVRFKGLVRWDGSSRTPYPDVIVPSFIPVVALLFRDFKDARPAHWAPLAIPIVGLGLILMGTLWVCARDVRAKTSRMGVAALFAFAYSVAVILHANARLEQLLRR
jgi:hypothetical protein